jgi:cob(I)alamin adenosyltransferase
VGTIDELNAAIGTARAQAIDDWLRTELLTTQSDLVVIMGEIATHPDDFERYTRDSFPLFKPEMLARLDGLVRQIEEQKISFKGWATPGANPLSAALDVARTACRRAERRMCSLHESQELRNPDPLVYFNRLSDVLWLMARWVETRCGSEDKH